MKKYLAQNIKTGSLGKVYHLYADCPGMSGRDVFEIKDEQLGYYKISKLCQRCSRRAQGENNAKAGS